MGEVQPIAQTDVNGGGNSASAPSGTTATTSSTTTTAKKHNFKIPKPPKKRQWSPPLHKTLPTDRITFPKQLDIIRAYAAEGKSGKPVTNATVAENVKLNASTVSLTNPFLSSIGLILKAEGGYSPAPEVISFLRANEWTPDTAAQELAPIIERTWFAEVLLPKISFSAMSEDAALVKLSDAAQASPKYRKQLRVLLDYLQAAGLIGREGGQITNPKNGAPTPSPRAASPEPAPNPLHRSAEAEAPGRGTTATAFSRTTEGAVHFNVSVKVDMKEMENWKPDRIAAFFAGIAQVLAAKADVEKKAV